MAAAERVLIVGGGIAGMALRISLQRAGMSADIVEVDDGWRVYGAGITITGPTLRAFDQFGLLEQIDRLGFLASWKCAEGRCRSRPNCRAPRWKL